VKQLEYDNRSISFIKPKEKIMKKILFVIVGVSLLSASMDYAKQVRDWRDMEETHKHVQEAIHEMERARAANHYDMKGHGEKAEKALHEAEHELHEAIEAVKSEK
jgi:hypothetical protein